MYTKWLLTCWLGLSFCAHGWAQSPSPLAIQVEDCQTLTVSLNTTASAKRNILPHTLILERALAADLWQKVKTVPSAMEQYTFRDLPFARYRVRLVDQALSGLAFGRALVEDQEGYLLSKVVTLSAANCSTDRSAARTLPSSGSALSVYPNPAREYLHVEWPTTWRVTRVALYSLTGKCLGQYPVTGPSLRMDLAALPSGIYLLQVQTSDQQRHSTRLSILP